MSSDWALWTLLILVLASQAISWLREKRERKLYLEMAEELEKLREEAPDGE